MLSLDQLGPRICIFGPPCSGKSTLAVQLAGRLGAPCLHLDQLAHYPGSQWQARPKAELCALHDIEILAPGWVIEGNYSICMPQRLDRATAAIWLDLNIWGCLARYLRRTFSPLDQRKGVLPGARERLNWMMISQILIRYPKSRPRHAALITGITGPIIHIRTMDELKALYRGWSL